MTQDNNSEDIHTVQKDAVSPIGKDVKTSLCSVNTDPCVEPEGLRFYGMSLIWISCSISGGVGL